MSVMPAIYRTSRAIPVIVGDTPSYVPPTPPDPPTLNSNLDGVLVNEEI
jgi:hypothetical protein